MEGPQQKKTAKHSFMVVTLEHCKCENFSQNNNTSTQTKNYLHALLKNAILFVNNANNFNILIWKPIKF